MTATLLEPDTCALPAAEAGIHLRLCHQADNAFLRADYDVKAQWAVVGAEGKSFPIAVLRDFGSYV